MNRRKLVGIFWASAVAVAWSACMAPLWAGEGGKPFISGRPARTPSSGYSWGGFVQPYFYPSSWGFGGFYSPFVNIPMLPPAYPYLPNYWWVSPYPTADPRQAGYNPASGYARDSVTTLILTTEPAKSRIILDGIFIGTSDYLGPTQLPLGEHVLRIEAPGFEPSETVLNIEQPVLQQLTVRLKRVSSDAPVEPRE